MVKMIRVAQILLIFLLFFSCGASKKMQKDEPYKPVIDTYWVLYAIQKEPVLYTDKPPYILFEPSGRYTGYTGCNHFFGNYQLKSKKLTLSYAGTTKKLCFEHNETEVAFLKMLKMEIWPHSVEKDTLWILGEQGELLHFVATDSIPGVEKRIETPGNTEEIEDAE